MYPLLENINKFVEENGISKSFVYVSSKRLPKYIVEVAVQELSKTGDACMIDDTCILSYDKKGHLTLILTFNEGSKRLVITDTKDLIEFPDKNFKYSRMRSDTIYKKAKRLEYIDFVINESYDSLYEKYIKKYVNKVKLSKDAKDRENAIKLLNFKNREIKSILRDEINLLIQEKFITEFRTMVSSVDHELEMFEDAAKQYITYLNNEYLEQMKSEVISFERAHIGYPKGVASKGEDNTGKERKNSVLPFDFRNEVINVLKPREIIRAQENDSESSKFDNSYYCYLINVSDNEYEIIIEPFNGTKYTKVFKLESTDKIDREKFKRIVTKYLTMSEKEVVDSNYAIRLGHTSDETYIASIWYSVTKDQTLKVNPNTKVKLDSLQFDSVEKQKSL